MTLSVEKLILMNQLAMMRWMSLTGMVHDQTLRDQIKATQERIEALEIKEDP